MTRLTSTLHLPTSWRSDLIAALAVTVIAVPQSLAYASLAGLPPHLGLFAAIFPPIIAALFGSSPFLVTGPVAMVSLLTASKLLNLAPPGSSQYVTLAITLTFSVGVIQLLLSTLKLGRLIKYISHTILLGFTNAAALIIAVSQLPKLFGLELQGNHSPFSTLYGLFFSLHEIQLPTVIFGFIPLFTILIYKRLSPRFPATLLVVVISIIVSMSTGYSGSIVGSIESNIPALNFPQLNLSDLRNLTVIAFVISIVSYMEGITVARALALKSNQILAPNRELLAQGLANLTSSVTSGIPVAGSFSRTAVNFSSGARSRLATISSGIMVLIVLIFFAPFIQFLPQATLAAIIISAVVGLANFHEPLHLLRSRPREGKLVLITFLTTLIFAPNLEYGILIGIALSILVHMHRAAHPQIQTFYLKEQNFPDSEHLHFEPYPTNDQVLAIAMDWSLSFANISYLEEVIIEALNSHPEIRYILILGQGINHIDHSSEEVLHQLTVRLKKKRITILYSGLKSHVISQLEKTHFFNFTKKSNLFPKANLALKAIHDRHQSQAKSTT